MVAEKSPDLWLTKFKSGLGLPQYRFGSSQYQGFISHVTGLQQDSIVASAV
jgi:hypothetical protein